jgi:hypothetical protein
MHVHGCGLLILMGKFTAQCYVDPEYELVALHPENFLPNGSPLVIYDPATQGYKCYVVAQDRCLREAVDPNSQPFPAFHHRAARGRDQHPNVFLVSLNAEVKFRHYLEVVRTWPPPIPLPDAIFTLMHRTLELVDLLYWWPVSTKGSKAEDSLTPFDSWVYSRMERHELRAASSRWANMDFEARRAYGTAAMSGPCMLSFLDLCRFLTMVLCLSQSRLL